MPYELSDQFYAVCFYMGGSWVYDSLHDITTEQKRLLVDNFTDSVGHFALAELVDHVKNDGPIPKCMEKRIG